MDKKRLAGTAAAIAVSAVSLVVAAQPQPSQEPRQPLDVFHNLKFRNLGPANAGGRVTAVAGLPGQPNI